MASSRPTVVTSCIFVKHHSVDYHTVARYIQAVFRGVYPYTIMAQLRHLQNWGGGISHLGECKTTA